MIKVVSFTSSAWHEVSPEDPGAYTCSYLDKLLDDGWQIKDWKTIMSQYNKCWTFVLEKNEE